MRLILLVLAFACGSVLAAGMSRDDYRAAKKEIAAEYQKERQKCGVRHGNALDLCVARAHATRDVAKAELEAKYKPAPRANYEAALARAKATYAVAKEQCDDMPRDQRKGCVADARNQRAADRAEARSRYDADKRGR